MASFMNGLSALGQGVAAFAGAAGLELQKSQLAQQQMILADQLATVHESKGRREAADIAAAAAEKEHGFLAGQGDLTRQNQLQVARTGAGATLGAANIHAAASNYAADMQSKNVYASIAAAAPEQAARILEQNQKTALEALTAHRNGPISAHRK